MNKFLMSLMVFGAMVFWLPMIADPYMTPRLLLVALGALGLLACKSNKCSSLEQPAIFMLVAVFVSAAFSHDVRYAIIGSYQFGTDSILACVCYFCVLLASARSGFSVDGIARAVTWASIPMSLYGIFQRFFRDPLIWNDLHGGTRVASTQGGPIFLGAVLAIAVLCAAHVARKGDRVAQAALAFALPCLWFTQTRGAMLAAGIGLAFIAPRLALLAVPAIALMPRFLHSALSDSTRVEVWKIALRVFADNPLTGYGNGNFYMAFRRYADWDLVKIAGNARYVQSHAHNDILHVAATAGIIGLVAYIVFGYSAIRVALGHAEKKFLLGILAAYAVVSSFNPVTASAFVLMALIFGAASSKADVFMGRRVLPAFASLVVALGVGRMTLANYHYAKAGLAKDAPALSAMEFQRAAELNPWEMFYSCRQVDSLMRLIPHMPLEQRKPLALAGRELAARAVKRHPMDAYAHELLGKQILIGYMAGYRDINPREGLKSFNRAQELAPTFEILMWRRRDAARVLGDIDQVENADKDIADLRNAVSHGRKS